MKNREPKLNISLPPRSSGGGFLTAIIFVLLISVLISGCFLEKNMEKAVIMSLTGIAVISLCKMVDRLRSEPVRRWFAAGFAVVALAAGLVFRSKVNQGLCIALNDISYRLAGVTGIIHKTYPEDGNWLIFILMIAVVTGLISAFIRERVAIAAGIFFFLLTATLWESGFFWNRYVIFAALVLSIALTVGGISQGYRGEKSRRPAVFITGACALLITALCFGLMAFDEKIDEAEKALKDSCCRALHEARYEDAKNPMPEGHLDRAGAFRPDESIALQISTNNDTTTYLKGFCGEKYEKGKWLPIRGEEESEESDLFYWLHREGFNGLGQMADIYEIAGTTERNYISMTVTNACKKYCYIPYGLDESSIRYSDPRQIGDSHVRATDEEGDYVFDVVPRAVENSYLLLETVSKLSAKKDPLAEGYLKQEKSYSDSVKRMYLDVPEKLEPLMERCLGKKKKLTTMEAKAVVLAYLGENIKYSENTGVAGDAFLEHFLKESKKGYSIHYATAAVMMLRYMGVPARYAEGYILPKDMASEGGEGKMIPLSSKYSHAWAEYYLEGVGWIPFETVPKYLDETEFAHSGKAKVSGKGQGADGDGKGDGPTASQSKSKGENHKDNPLNRIGKVFVMNKLLALIPIILVIVVIALIQALRRRKLKIFLRSIEEGDEKGAIKAFAYSLALIKASGIDINYTMLRESAGEVDTWLEKREGTFESCINAYEHIRYGNGFGEDRRQEVLSFKKDVFKRLTRDRKKIDRFKDRVIRCIY